MLVGLQTPLTSSIYLAVVLVIRVINQLSYLGGSTLHHLKFDVFLISLPELAISQLAMFDDTVEYMASH
jgi:hypothetical protein